MSKVTVARVFEIETHATIRTRTYYRRVSIEASGLTQTGWMCLLLNALEIRTRQKPEPTADVISFRDGLNLLVATDAATELLNLRPEQVGRLEIRRIFLLFENALINSERPRSVKERIGTYFRKYVLDLIPLLDVADVITRKTLRFRTRMYISSLPRRVISDAPGLNGEDHELQMPLAAMPHKTIKELYRNSLARLEIDLQKVIEACRKELLYWETIRKTVHTLAQETFRSSQIQLCEHVRHVGAKWAMIEYSKLPAHLQLALYCQAVEKENLAKANSQQQGCHTGRFPNVRRLLSIELGLTSQRLAGTRPYQVLFLPQRMNSCELIAAFVLLLCYTGWNAHSLVNMTVDDIKFSAGSAHIFEQVSIKGFKSKTDDDTPEIVLDSTQPFAAYALELLIWNNRQLRRLGVIEPDERMLWFSYSNKGNMKQQFIGFQHALAVFISRHSLPKFSFDQIRPHVLLTEQLRFNNVDRVRELAGHATISTTGRYHNQELFRRLNSAINLEFQRRLQATVHFRLREQEDSWKNVPNPDHVDPDLIVAIGDGASCRNPGQPPFMSYLEGDVCDGRGCHEGDGCPNRLIWIDEDRIEELVRRRRYYLVNWARLFDENREAFETIHLGRILFSLGLYDFIKESRYSHVLKGIEHRVGDEWNREEKVRE
ncbi:hypothetical protein [Pseudoduganella sp. R-34]|uniref:hypothetical protein n=1 Tax=Pseudoduganella sp. R-34 TaxID=3404062 RepID=UPI003CE6BF73